MFGPEDARHRERREAQRKDVVFNILFDARTSSRSEANVQTEFAAHQHTAKRKNMTVQNEFRKAVKLVSLCPIAQKEVAAFTRGARGARGGRCERSEGVIVTDPFMSDICCEGRTSTRWVDPTSGFTTHSSLSVPFHTTHRH